jgi:segregation and condensation protein B
MCNPDQKETGDTLAAKVPDAPAAAIAAAEERRLLALIECAIYASPEPVSLLRLARAVGELQPRVAALVEELALGYDRRASGLQIRKIAGGYQIATRPEFREQLESIVASAPPAPLSLPALETLAVIAYRQPVSAGEILATREVKGMSVLKTLLRRKLITTVRGDGKQLLYKTTRRFLLDFGLQNLAELPSMEEFRQTRQFKLDPP